MPRYLWPARPESGDDASARGNFSGAFRPSSDVRNHDGTIDEPRAVEPVAPMVIRSRRTRGPAPLDAPVGDPITGATNLWLPVGPSVVMNGQASGRPTVSGRVRDIRIEPTTGDRVYAASAGGGVWRSLDAGESWEPLDGFVVSPNRSTFTPVGSALACGALHVRFGAAANGDDDVLVVGTGEPPNATFDSADPGANPGGNLTGVGILTWSGATVPARKWQIDPGSEALRGGYVRAFAESPLDARHLFAATNDGVYHRPIGEGWSKIATAPRGCSDVLVTRVDATHVTIWVSTFGGLRVASTAVPIPAAGPAFSSVQLPAAVNPCNKALSLGGPTQLWVFGKRSRTGTLDYDPAGLWRVDPTAATPTAVEVTGVPLQVFRAGKNDQSSYDICIAVHPDHPERLLVGGSTVLIGGVWSASLYSLLVAGNVATPTIVGDGVHADLHVVRFGPRVSPLLPVRSVWVGCDGGVFSSIADGVNASFRSRNHELSTLEPGFVACHPTNDGIIAAGMQDNGTCLRVGDTLWGFVNGGGGDGGGTVFDPGTTNRHFMQYTQNSWTSSDGSSTGFLRFPKPDGDPETSRSLFYSGASALVHGGLTNLLVGSDRPWYSPDWGQTWVTIPSGKDPRKTANVDYTTDRINPDSREDPTFLCCGSGDAGPEVITTRLSAADNGVTRIRALVLNSGNLTILLGTSPDLILQRWTWTREIVERIRPADSSAEKAAVANGDPTTFLPARDLVTDVAVHVPGRGAHGSCYLTTKGAGSPTIDTVWWYDGSGHFVPCGVRHTNSRGTWTGDRFIAPALAVVVDPREPDHVYVGTGIGVIHGVQSFVTINGVQEPRWAWSPLVNGLPESAVNDLAIFDNGAPGPVGPTGPIRLLRAALHGRGVWELDLANPLTRPRTYLRVRETDTRRRTPTALAGASFAGDTISRFDRSPDIVIDRTGSIDMGPGPYEADLWTRGGGPGPASMGTVFSARAFKVHVLVHHRWHTAAPAANVRVALLRLDVTFALGDPAVPANLWQTLVNVNAGAAVPPAVPGAWRAASAQLVRPVAAAIDTRRPRAATFDLNLAGHPNGRVMLMAVVLSGDDPITVGERLKPDGTACTTLSDFVLFSRHVAARSILLTT